MKCHVAHRELRQRAQYGARIEAGIISIFLLLYAIDTNSRQAIRN